MISPNDPCAAFRHPREVAAATPDKPAFIMVDEGMRTYAELVRRADRAAHMLRSLGAAAGDTIAIFAENDLSLPELCWAAKNGGLHYVCISSQLNTADYRYIVADCDARLVVTTQRLAPIAASAREDRPDLLLVVLDGAVADALDYEALLAAQPDGRIADENSGASMLYSSGTTGRPKGVRMPLKDVPPEEPPLRQRILIDAFGFGVNTVFVNPGPLYHAAPLRMMMAVMRLGGTTIGFQGFDPEPTLAAIARYRATHGFFVPTMFTRMLRVPEDTRSRYDTRSMRVAIHAAAPCPIPIKQAMLDWWGPVIHEIYGGTEGMGHTIVGPEDWLRRPGTVGRPPPGCELEIRSATGERLGPGKNGLVYFRNATRFAYHNDAVRTAEAYAPDGFSSLGDIGHVDADDWLYLTDRHSHMIISGGVNIYPQEAENVLIGHPAVADVAVIGVPDDDYGERVLALVEPAATSSDPEALADEIIAFCRAHLSAIKCPRAVEFVTQLPRDELGKLRKRELRAPYWAGCETLIR